MAAWGVGEDAHLFKVLPVFLDTAQYTTGGEGDDDSSAMEKMYRKVFDQADADGEVRTRARARVRGRAHRLAQLGPRRETSTRRSCRLR